MEFQGTKIENEDEYSISYLVNEYNIHNNGQFIGMAYNEYDADTFYDSLLVRQKINFDLPELHERYLKMKEAIDKFNGGWDSFLKNTNIGNSYYNAENFAFMNEVSIMMKALTTK